MKNDILNSQIDRTLLAGREYRGASRIDGPLVYMRNTHPVGYGELVEILAPDGSVRSGQVLDTSDEAVCVQCFEGTEEELSITKNTQPCLFTMELAAARAIISKESALIRNAFREEDKVNAQSNMAKLLFIHLMGYPSYFGQVQSVKLIASPDFGDKRIGYLSLSLLVSEDNDIFLLVTNTLKSDINSGEQFGVLAGVHG